MIALAPSAATHAALAALAALARRYDPVSLEELRTAALLDRFDTKFLLPARRLATALHDVAAHYRAIEVRGTRLCRYATQYFDTEDLALYHAHHAGRLPRCKVRLRTYVETDERFLELKVKTNAGRTLKARLPADADAPLDFAQLAQSPLYAMMPVPPAALREIVHVRYVRLTLVRERPAERVTVDVALDLSAGDGSVTLPGLAVVELKQERRGASPLVESMRRLGHRPAALSKYCLGVARLHACARTNRFHQILHQIDEVLRDDRRAVLAR